LKKINISFYSPRVNSFQINLSNISSTHTIRTKTEKYINYSLNQIENKLQT